MPVENIVYGIRMPKASVELNNFNDTVVLRLTLPGGGFFLILGRVVIANFDTDSQTATARLTREDGFEELDRVDIRIGGAGDGALQSISLQAALSLPLETSGDLIDLRCGTYKGFAFQSSLLAMQVDETEVGII